MSLPTRLVRVTWEAARHPDRPWDRVEHSRNYTSRDAAGRQVAMVRLWEPCFMRLLGVWECTGGDGQLEWDVLDPDVLPVPEQAQSVAQALRQYSPAYAAMINLGVPDAH